MLQCDDLTFSASSRSTFVAQQLVFAAVIADAAMVLEVLERDHIGATFTS